MNAPNLNPELEQKLREALDMPAPDPAFANRLRAELISKAGEMKPALRPEQRRSRLAWRLAFVIVLLALLGYFFGPKIVNAMKQLLGYVPGAGLVDQSLPLRVLSEPVSVTRDGITLTVESALLSVDKSVVTYTLKNVPWEVLSHQEGVPGCGMLASLRLPDGKELAAGEGGGTMYSFTFTYPPIAADVNDATLLLSCIQDALPGKAPENWQVDLHFVPAPLDFKVAPVVEIQTPTKTADNSAPGSQPLVLEKVVETEHGYILMGRFIKHDLAGGGIISGFSQWPVASIPDGQELVTVVPSDISTNSADNGSFAWAYEVTGKPKTTLILTFDSIDVDYPDLQASFQFDTGANPADNQTWELNKEIKIGDHTVKVISAKRMWNGYLFRFENNTGVNEIDITINGNTSSDFFEYGKGELGSQIKYPEAVPSGNLTVTVSSARASIHGPWQVQWQPQAAISQPASQNALTLVKMVDLPDGYILAGTFRPVELPMGADSLRPYGMYRVTDANGKEILSEEPQDQILSAPIDPNTTNWAVQIKGKDFAFPLTVSLDAAEASFPNARASFEFDAGKNPQMNQVFKPEAALELDGHKVSVDSITYTGKGYAFELTADPDVTGVGVTIAGFPADGGGGGGDGQGHLSAGLDYASQPPTGHMTATLEALTLRIPGPWQVQWQPKDAQPGTPSLYGISLAVDKYIPLEDGYYLIGHSAWSDSRINRVIVGGMSAFDSAGEEIPLEPASASDAGIDGSDPSQWVYKLYGKAFSGPVRLQVSEVSAGFVNPPTVEIDLKQYGFTGSDDQLGNVYKVGLLPIDLPGLSARLLSIGYQRNRDLKGFAIYIEADASIISLPLDMDPAPAGAQHGSGGSARTADGKLVDYSFSDGTPSGQFKLRTDSANISGKWETTWTPPNINPAAKTELQNLPACLSLESWKKISANPPALPDLPGRLVVYGRILKDNQPPSPDNYGVLLTDLAGTKRQDFGKGVNPSASADGTLLAYNWDDGIHLVRTASRQDALLPGLNRDDFGPRLSPDGRILVFVRPADMNLYLVNTDGSGLRQFTDTPSIEEYAQGWTADGSQVLYLKIDSGRQSLVAKAISDGQETTLMAFASSVGGLAVSADGRWLAYSARVRGRTAGGVYLAALDGSSSPKLLAQLDHWLVDAPVWSPDGQWLMLQITNTDSFEPQAASALLNISTCETIPVSSFEGTAQGWVR